MQGYFGRMLVIVPLQWSLDRENPDRDVSLYAPVDGVEQIFGGMRP